MIFRHFFCAVGIVIFFASCGSKNEKEQADMDFQTRIRIKQYMSAGKQLYDAKCANCHQENGEGFAALYPPLRNSDYFIADIPASVCAMKFGMEGEIVVNGTTFDQKMPGDASLTDLELAEITTFLLNEFHDSTVIVTQHDIRNFLEACDTNSVVR